MFAQGFAAMERCVESSVAMRENSLGIVEQLCAYLCVGFLNNPGGIPGILQQNIAFASGISLAL